ncbi:hypothetical protein ALQ54_00651 [Pseudomonas syringae]|nr:hypothetical protein ALQ54_00651 [Pseudomonas syringae]
MALKALIDADANVQRWHKVCDAPRYMAVFLCQADWGSAQVTFSPLGDLL